MHYPLLVPNVSGLTALTARKNAFMIVNTHWPHSYSFFLAFTTAMLGRSINNPQ